MGLKYYVIDTETTGLSVKAHEIFQISIIRCDDLHQITKNIKIDNLKNVSKEALMVCKKELKDLLTGESKISVVNACNDFFNQDGLTSNHRCMIAYNAPFDYRFCKDLWLKCNMDFPAIYWLDTLKLARQWSKKTGILSPNYKLNTFLKTANIKPYKGEHEASVDAKNNFLLWKKLLENKIDILSNINNEGVIIW